MQRDAERASHHALEVHAVAQRKFVPPKVQLSQCSLPRFEDREVHRQQIAKNRLKQDREAHARKRHRVDDSPPFSCLLKPKLSIFDDFSDIVADDTTIISCTADRLIADDREEERQQRYLKIVSTRTVLMISFARSYLNNR